MGEFVYSDVRICDEAKDFEQKVVVLDTGFFQPKDDKGNWIEPFDPLSYENPCFVEGNAWQYMWFVPQNPQGLIDLFGGVKPFIAKLNETLPGRI